jgi:hypothetical protein
MIYLTDRAEAHIFHPKKGTFSKQEPVKADDLKIMTTKPQHGSFCMLLTETQVFRKAQQNHNNISSPVQRSLVDFLQQFLQVGKNTQPAGRSE